MNNQDLLERVINHPRSKMTDVRIINAILNCKLLTFTPESISVLMNKTLSRSTIMRSLSFLLTLEVITQNRDGFYNKCVSSDTRYYSTCTKSTSSFSSYSNKEEKNKEISTDGHYNKCVSSDTVILPELSAAPSVATSDVFGDAFDNFFKNKPIYQDIGKQYIRKAPEPQHNSFVPPNPDELSNAELDRILNM